MVTEYFLTQQDFQNELNEQLKLLESSISNYSKHEFEAKRVAAIIRILVHDTNSSTSLLKSLNKKDSIYYINSASPNDGRLHSMSGLRNVKGSNTNQYFGLIAKINEKGMLKSVPLFQQHLATWHSQYKLLSFEAWWNMEIFNVYGKEWSRKSLVLNVANKDGGSHIDPSHSEDYHKAKNSKLTLNIKGKNTEFERNVVYASIIQIGWELLSSLK